MQNPNSASELLVDLVNGCVKKATFALKQNKQKNIIPRKIQITNAIIISCKTKGTLYNIFKRNPTSEFTKKQYRDYCKILDKVIKDGKHKFEYDTFKKCGNNPRQLWNLINEKLGKNKVQSNQG